MRPRPARPGRAARACARGRAGARMFGNAAPRLLAARPRPAAGRTERSCRSLLTFCVAGVVLLSSFPAAPSSDRSLYLDPQRPACGALARAPAQRLSACKHPSAPARGCTSLPGPSCTASCLSAMHPRPPVTTPGCNSRDHSPGIPREQGFCVGGRRAQCRQGTPGLLGLPGRRLRHRLSLAPQPGAAGGLFDACHTSGCAYT
jgi:hypothetical protein